MMLNEMNLIEEKITTGEGFQAMKLFLEKWYEFTESDDIAFILSGMGMDPAFYEDWVKSVDIILQKR